MLTRMMGTDGHTQVTTMTLQPNSDEEHCLAYGYRSRNRHQTCELNNMSPADGVRFGSDTEHKLCCNM